MPTNSTESSAASIRLAQAMADTRQENVWLIVNNHSGVYRAVPNSEFIGINNRRDETIMRLLRPR